MHLTAGLPISKRRCLDTLLLLFLLFLHGSQAGCASKYGQGSASAVPFELLLSEAKAHQDADVVLGGYILETLNEPDGSLLTMLQAPLGFRQEPKERDLSKGRFLVKSEQFLDPAVYSKDRKLTVWGKVLGARPEALGNRVYEYPVIEAGEIRLWPKETPRKWPYDPFYDCWPYWWHRYPFGPYRCW